MTSGREKMIRGIENCKNGRGKKYNGVFYIGLWRVLSSLQDAEKP